MSGLFLVFGPRGCGSFLRKSHLSVSWSHVWAVLCKTAETIAFRENLDFRHSRFPSHRKGHFWGGACAEWRPILTDLRMSALRVVHPRRTPAFAAAMGDKTLRCGPLTNYIGHLFIFAARDSGVWKYTQGDVTSHNLWSRHDRHFVGITCITHNVICGVKGRRFTVLFEQNWISQIRKCPYDHWLT